MARVVCQAVARKDRVTFLWSEGTASFPPYTLDGAAFADLARLADQAQRLLAQLGAGAGDVAGANHIGAELARVGHALYRLVFQLDLTTGAAGQEVRDWLNNAKVESFEILGDGLGLPWNILCERPPEGTHFDWQ